VIVKDSAGEMESHPLVDEIIQFLQGALMIQDDFEFATNFAQQKKDGAYGPGRIRLLLLQKGIPEPVIERALDEVFKEDDEDFEKLDSLIRSAWGSSNEGNLYKKKQKIVSKLAQRGFPLDQIFSRMDEFLDRD
jgi:SOS response regulatory protein OraA/RecX